MLMERKLTIHMLLLKTMGKLQNGSELIEEYYDLREF